MTTLINLSELLHNLGVHKSQALEYKVIKLRTVTPNSIIRVFFLTQRSVHHFISTEQLVPDTSQIHRSLQNCESNVWNLLHNALPVPKIWRRLPEFLKICGPLIQPQVLKQFNFTEYE